MGHRLCAALRMKVPVEGQPVGLVPNPERDAFDSAARTAARFQPMEYRSLYQIRFNMNELKIS